MVDVTDAMAHVHLLGAPHCAMTDVPVRVLKIVLETVELPVLEVVGDVALDVAAVWVTVLIVLVPVFVTSSVLQVGAPMALFVLATAGVTVAADAMATV